MPKLLETITSIGNTALVPISKIQSIILKADGRHDIIAIYSEGSMCWPDRKKFLDRVQGIRKLIESE